NFSNGANALAHAKAQYNGNFDNMSAHYYTDDGDVAYQAASNDRGCWHVGVNYGGRLFGTANNRNTIGVEMCVQSGYNFNAAFTHTVELVMQLMAETGISADKVLQHYDVCAKNCPSQIRAKGMWEEFKRLIASSGSSGSSSNTVGQGIKSASGFVKVTYTGSDGLNVRAAPSLGENVNQVVHEGTFTVVGISEDGEWYQLKSGLFITTNAKFVQFTESGTTSSNGNVMVRITIPDLNIRMGAGTDYARTGNMTGIGTVTIVETKEGEGSDSGWGRLFSGAGWISLDYAKRI
ncbi:MAG: N-acetylmuramoyl-L-alanine amidase, partial [Hungatella sp.]